MDKNEQKIIQKSWLNQSEAERHSMVNEMLKNKWTKQYTWQVYTGEPNEHGVLLQWMRSVGYVKQTTGRRVNFDKIISQMPRKNASIPADDSFETLQLKKRISELERQLRESEIKAIAYATMIDIAERELKISIKKKFNTKPSQK